MPASGNVLRGKRGRKIFGTAHSRVVQEGETAYKLLFPWLEGKSLCFSVAPGSGSSRERNQDMAQMVTVLQITGRGGDCQVVERRGGRAVIRPRF